MNEHEPAETMTAEFDTVADWTAEAALVLGPDYYVPAGCRGSGGPAALDWLLSRLGVAPAGLLLDVGAGVGGPAAYAKQRAGVRPLLLEPQPGACRAAMHLFDLPTARASATALPVRDGSIAAAWSLGVLDTIDDHAGPLAELARCLTADGALGLLVYVGVRPVHDGPEGNHFLRPDEMERLADRTRLRITDRVTLTDLPAEPADWKARSDAVDREIARRHGHRVEWRQSIDQQHAIAEVLRRGEVGGELLVLRRA